MTKTVAVGAESVATVAAVEPIVAVFDASSLYAKKDTQKEQQIIEVIPEPITPVI